MTSQEDDLTGRQPHSRATSQQDNLTGRRPHRKTTSQKDNIKEYDLKVRQLHRKTTSQEDNLRGGQAHRKMTNLELSLAQLRPRVYLRSAFAAMEWPLNFSLVDAILITTKLPVPGQRYKKI